VIEVQEFRAEVRDWLADNLVGEFAALKGLGAAFKTIKGGEVTQYTELLEDSRRHAMDRMIENARAMGANAVVMMRFDSSEMGQTMTEVVAYGTAAIIERSAT